MLFSIFTIFAESTCFQFVEMNKKKSAKMYKQDKKMDKTVNKTAKMYNQNKKIDKIVDKKCKNV